MQLTFFGTSAGKPTKDKIDFISEESHSLFWKTFKHYNTINTWSYHNFSSVESKEYQFNMKMVNQNTNKTLERNSLS